MTRRRPNGSDGRNGATPSAPSVTATDGRHGISAPAGAREAGTFTTAQEKGGTSGAPAPALGPSGSLAKPPRDAREGGITLTRSEAATLLAWLEPSYTSPAVTAIVRKLRRYVDG